MIKNIRALVRQFQPSTRWLILYYSSRCPDCVAFKPVWRKIVTAVRNNFTGINLAMIESSEIPKNARVSYYPTLIYYNDRTEIRRLTDKNSKMSFSDVLDFVRKSASRPKTPKTITLKVSKRSRSRRHRDRHRKRKVYNRRKNRRR